MKALWLNSVTRIPDEQPSFVLPKTRAGVVNGAIHAKNGGRKRRRVLMGSCVFGGVPKIERIGRNPYRTLKVGLFGVGLDTYRPQFPGLEETNSRSRDVT